MSNKNNTYWENRPGRSLPPDTCKRNNRVNIHCNSRRASFSLPGLPFGNTPAPAEFTTFSEAEIDLGNDLLQDESWDTDDINSSHRSLLPQEEKQQPESHLETAEPLVVDITAI